MAMPGSGSYYMQRGMPGSGSGSGPQPGLHGSPGIRSLSNPSMPFQPNIGGGGSMGSTLPVEPSSVISTHGVNVGAPSTLLPPSEPVKRKRGRPRKYGPDGTVSLALSPSSATSPGTLTASTQKRGRGRPPGTGRKQQLASLGEISFLNFCIFFLSFCTSILLTIIIG